MTQTTQNYGEALTVLTGAEQAMDKLAGMIAEEFAQAFDALSGLLEAEGELVSNGGMVQVRTAAA